MKNFKKILDRSFPIHVLALGLGSGLSPILPGTCGTVMGLIIWFLLLQSCSLTLYFLIIAFCFILGIFICDITERALGSSDPGCIVWDECVGLWFTFLALYFIPNGTTRFVWIVLGFLLFRFFDMLKPWPIRVFDRKVHGGFGIMLDDLIAALFAGCLLWLIAILL